MVIITGRLPWQPDGIKFTQCVSDQKSAFSPLQEKLALDRKMFPPFRIITTFSISIQSLGEIELRVLAVGAKISVFLYVMLGLPTRGGHSSNKYCVTVYGSILMPFPAIFFKRDCSVRYTTWFSFTSPGGATIFAKLPSKITKSPKIGGKVYAHHFV